MKYFICWMIMSHLKLYDRDRDIDELPIMICEVNSNVKMSRERKQSTSNYPQNENTMKCRVIFSRNTLVQNRLSQSSFFQQKLTTTEQLARVFFSRNTSLVQNRLPQFFSSSETHHLDRSQLEFFFQQKHITSTGSPLTEFFSLAETHHSDRSQLESFQHKLTTWTQASQNLEVRSNDIRSSSIRSFKFIAQVSK